jgi:hypothetical protein
LEAQSRFKWMHKEDFKKISGENSFESRQHPEWRKR